jgi:hypothetical protein
MGKNSYKFDSRTEEEFIEDLRRGLKNEVDSIRKFERILKSNGVENPEVVYVGSDEEGEVVYDSNNNIADVDLFPDYLLKYKEQRRIRYNFIEVKVCNPHSPFAYFKVKQLEQYNEVDSVRIMFVMGLDTKYPMFILVNPEDILKINVEPTTVYGKETLVVPVDYFEWENFSENALREHEILKKNYIRPFALKSSCA